MSNIILVFIAGGCLDETHPQPAAFKATQQQFDEYVRLIKNVIENSEKEQSSNETDSMEVLTDYWSCLERDNCDLVPTHYATVSEWIGSYIRYEVSDVHRLNEKLSYDTNVYDTRDFK